MSALLAIDNANFVDASHIDEEARSRFFKRHGFQPVGIQLHIRQLLTACHVDDADQAVWCFSCATAVHHVKILRRGIVYCGVCIYGQLGVAHQFVRIVIVNFELGSFSVHNKDFPQLWKSQHVVGSLEPDDGMN